MKSITGIVPITGIFLPQSVIILEFSILTVIKKNIYWKLFKKTTGINSVEAPFSLTGSSKKATIKTHIYIYIYIYINI
jgi:hypothetical protein